MEAYEVSMGWVPASEPTLDVSMKLAKQCLSGETPDFHALMRAPCGVPPPVPLVLRGLSRPVSGFDPLKEPTRHKPRAESVRGASSSRAWQGGRGAAHRAYTPKGKGGIPSARQAAEDEAAWRRGGAGGRVPPPVHAARDAASAEAARVASERADELRRKKVEEQEIYRRVRAETAAEFTAAHERAEEGRVLAAAALAETNELRARAVKAQQAAEAALEEERAARGPAGGGGGVPPPPRHGR